ncbi:hypothetical protein WR25_04486 [Diploscapter pachys]|uniref:Uncharacterized protein n=1 Tax=Diploscapter pachys TaxID=2018661 RepID=A0A2A2LFY0_9BILA|nr:hypothetical protein WR25_04486 [Diploscapter pachys]
MSSSRLAVSGFVRKGQRFVSLPHANGERKEEEETLELGQNGQRAENKQERLVAIDLTVPLVNLRSISIKNNDIQFTPRLAGSSIVPPIWQQEGVSHGVALLNSQPSTHELIVQSLVPHRTSKEIACQTDEIMWTAEENLKAQEKEQQDIHWHLEALISEELIKEGDMREAVKRLHKAAANGNGMAMNHLAELFYTGTGVKENKPQAIDLWKQSAELGYAPAMYTLAVCYKNGDGIEANETEAMKWMERAAIAGNSDAAFYQLARYIRAGDASKVGRYVTTAIEDVDNKIEIQTWIDDRSLPPEFDAILQKATNYRPEKEETNRSANKQPKPPVLFYLNTN